MDKIPKKNLDIQQILDKIKTLPIDDTDKATILEEIKKNITHPSTGENQNLDNIQSKYTKINMPRGQLGQFGQSGQYGQSGQSGQTNFHQMHDQYNPLSNPLSNPIQNSNLMPIMDYQQQNPNNQSTPMTSAQFEILKNKIDSLQYELIDLLRHVKDYTQRYMNAVRQQDLDKINEYINGLFEVDKTLKETQALAASTEPIKEDEDETKEEAQKSVITRATSGIKNFFGSIGNNVSGITDLVKSTADVANGYLTKKVVPSNTSNTENTTVNKKTNTIINNNISKGSRKSNIVSVDDYISDMNEMEEINKNKSITPISNSNIISTSSNNINSLGSNNLQVKKEEPIINNEETVDTEEPVETEDESQNLEGALEKLNKTMNEDIENTVNSNSNNINQQEQSGGGNKTKKNIKNNKNNYITSKKESNLTHKIRLLRLNLTKKKLQKELNDNKLGMNHHVKSIHSKKKKINIHKKNSSGKITKHS